MRRYAPGKTIPDNFIEGHVSRIRARRCTRAPVCTRAFTCVYVRKTRMRDRPRARVYHGDLFRSVSNRASSFWKTKSDVDFPIRRRQRREVKRYGAVDTV